MEYKDLLKKDIDDLFKQIEHGDYEHRKWLKDKMDDFVVNRKPTQDFKDLICTNCDQSTVANLICCYCQKPILDKEKMIEFLSWISNNWFIPSRDSMWVLDTENIEYHRTIAIERGDIFTAEDLIEMFELNEGEN